MFTIHANPDDSLITKERKLRDVIAESMNVQCDRVVLITGLHEMTDDVYDYMLFIRDPCAPRHWVDIEKLDMYTVSQMPEAVPWLEKNPHLIHWGGLCLNPAAIHLIEPYMEHIVPASIDADRERDMWSDDEMLPHMAEIPNRMTWIGLCANPNMIPLLLRHADKLTHEDTCRVLSRNPNAIPLLEAHPELIDWAELSRNPSAIRLLEANLDRVDWPNLSENPSAGPLMEAHPESIYENAAFFRNPTTLPLFLSRWEKECIPEDMDAKQQASMYAVLCENPNPEIIAYLQTRVDKLDSTCWSFLSHHPHATPLLEANLDKVNWHTLSWNPNAIPLLEAHIEKVDSTMLSYNPNAVHLLERHPYMIDWKIVSCRADAIHLIEEYVQVNGDNSEIYKGLSYNPAIFV